MFSRENHKLSPPPISGCASRRVNGLLSRPGSAEFSFPTAWLGEAGRGKARFFRLRPGRRNR